MLSLRFSAGGRVVVEEDMPDSSCGLGEDCDHHSVYLLSKDHYHGFSEAGYPKFMDGPDE
jgi:hypothetical protein